MIKKIFLAILIFIGMESTAQTLYTSTPDSTHSGQLIFNGIVTKQNLANEPSFTWYANNQKGYEPNAALISKYAAAKDSIKYVVFGGTWCEDTQSILPKFFKLLELAGVPDGDVSFFGVDRKKTVVGGINQAFGITHVPTIIAIKNGKEIGRVVEYGQTGKWDEELAANFK